MLVAIKKCEFFTRKTDFVRFIIKLGQLSIDLKKIKAIVNQYRSKEDQGYSKLVRTRERYAVKIVPRVLQLLQKVYSVIVTGY